MAQDSPQEMGVAGIRQSFGRHLLATARLALPIMVARAGLIIMITVANVFTSRHGAETAAAFALALAPQLVLIFVAIGLLGGVAVLTAQALGAGERERAGRIWRASVLYAAGLGVVLGLAGLLSGPVFTLLGQPEALARAAGTVAFAFAPGMPALLVFVATSLTLEALGRPRPAMLAMIAGNLANLGLCAWAVPAFGAAGAALAMSLARWLMAIGLVAYLLHAMPDRGLFGLAGKTAPAERRSITAALRRLGYPLATAQAVESTAFAAFVLLAGRMGAASLAAYNIAINITTLIFMTVVGIAAAACVRVGHAVGRGDGPSLRRAGWAAVTLAVATVAVISGLNARDPSLVVSLYTQDPAVLGLAAAAVMVASLGVVFDSVQGSAMGALRGLGDIWVPTVLQCASFWLVGVGAATVFAFILDLGVVGLFLGILASTATAAVLTTTRFGIVSRRALRRA